MTFKEKLSSGKFLVTVLIVSTYCFVMLGCCVLVVTKFIDAPTFLGLFAGFSTLAGTIVTGYFNKKEQA